MVHPSVNQQSSLRIRPSLWQRRSNRKIQRFVFGVVLGLWLMLVGGWAIATPTPRPASPILHSDLIQRGRILYQTGHFLEAKQTWQQALSTLDTDPLRQAHVWMYLAEVYDQMGDQEQANTAITNSQEILNRYPDEVPPLLWAQLLSVQGHVQFSQGEYSDALDIWEQAEARYHSVQDAVGELGTRINQTRAMQALGLYRRARMVLEQLQQEVLTQTDPALKVMGLRQLGNALRVIGDLKQSRQVLEESLTIAETHQLGQDIPMTLLSLGHTVRLQGDQQAALQFYEQSGQRATTPNTQIQAQVSEFRVRMELAQWESARSLLSTLQATLTARSTDKLTLYARINVAQSLLAAEDNGTLPVGIFPPTEIAQLLSIAIQQAKQLGDGRAESYASGYLGKVYTHTHQWETAQTLTQQALLLSQSTGATDIAYQWQWQLGHLKKIQGDTAGAIAAYTEAVNTLQSLRSDLIATNLDVQYSFRENVEPVYRELVMLLLGDDGATPTQEHLKQARQIVEALQLAELENFFRETCLDRQTVNVDQIDARAAVVYPIVLSDRLAIILSLPNQQLRYYVTFRPQSEIQQAIDAMRQSLRRTAFPTEYLPASQHMYDLLIRPFIADLTANQVSTLVFKLDGTLQNLPLAVLHDGEQFLVQRFNLALSPGLQLLAPEPPLSRERITALIGGLSAASQGFSALPGVEEEIEQIATKVSSRILLNQTFTRQQLQDQINFRAYSIVHLATHGQFSSSADNTFLLTWDDRINVRQLDALLRSQDAVHAHPIELLILSACQTAAGDRRAALGLAGVAVRSGARSTLATLWLVNDEATADFITEFYRQLTQTGTSRAEALRQAQIQLLTQPQYRHPYYWGAFVLIGNWT